MLYLVADALKKTSDLTEVQNVSVVVRRYHADKQQS